MCILCVGLPVITCPSTSSAAGSGSGSPVMAGSKPSLTTDEVAAKIAVTSWSGATMLPITYGYRSTSTDADFVRFNAEQIRGTELALSMWSDVANIQFQRAGTGTTGEAAYSNNASILFNAANTGSFYAYAYYPGDRAAGSLDGDIYFNNQDGSLLNLTNGTYGYLAALHEIGHAIGISHPGAYNGGAPTYAANAEYLQDSRQYSVMSYFNAEETGAVHGFTFASAPLLHDIAAAQRLYGVNTTTRTGDTVYGFNSNTGRDAFTLTLGSPAPIFAVWDAGGNDTLDFSGYSDDQLITLVSEGFSSVGGLVHNVAIAKGATIENARGGFGDDVLTGNSAANVLEGNAGNDSLSGGTGDDQLIGGHGSDTLEGGNGTDTAVFALARSAYAVQSALINSQIRVAITDIATGVTDYVTGTEIYRFADGAYTSTQLGTGSTATSVAGTAGDDNLNGTNGRDLIDGKEGNDLILGGLSEDRLAGGAGNDTLDGGTGADIMIGGIGDDQFIVDNLADRVVELAGQGADTVITTLASYRLADNVEKLVGTSITGARLAGNVLANEITGSIGNDTLDGTGGNDTMIGGLGNDTYGVDSIGDVITENSGEGTDTVRTTLARYTLGDTLENLTGIATVAQTLTGNGVANEIRGANGNDTLDGGAGGDRMAGSLGNDLYLVDNDADVITEGMLAGYDTVRSSAATTTLSANVEDLVGLLSTGQTLTGNANNNRITAGAGNDTITDGAGNDTITAGDGDDLIKAGAGTDMFSGGTGYDTLDFSGATAAVRIDATLRKVTGTTIGIDNYSAIEELHGSAFGDTFIGSAGADMFLGLGGNDSIRGGKGSDDFTGGAGNDTYLWLAGDADSAIDMIRDFAVGDVVNVRGLLAGRTFAGIDDKVVVEDGADGSTISVNMGGTLGFVAVAHLDGIHGQTAQTMLEQGMLLA